jgi:hypothetical protein
MMPLQRLRDQGGRRARLESIVMLLAACAPACVRSGLVDTNKRVFDPTFQLVFDTIVVSEGGSVVLTPALITATSERHSAESLHFVVDAPPRHGQLISSSGPAGEVAAFSQADIDAGLVTLRHDGSETTSDSFAIRVVDDEDRDIADASAAVPIRIIPVNDLPTLTVHGAVQVAIGGRAIITATVLDARDPDDPTTAVLYFLETAPLRGSLELSGVALAVGDGFSQSDVVAGRLAYTHSGSLEPADSFAVTLGNPGIATRTAAVQCPIAVGTPSPWLDLGGSGSGGGVTSKGSSAHAKSGATDGSGGAYVTWVDAYTGTSQIYLLYWDGTAWSSLGGSGDGNGISGTGLPGDPGGVMSGVALDSNSRPYVCWVTAGAMHLYVKAWDGSAWVELGGSATGSGLLADPVAVWWPSIMVDASDHPVVAYEVSSGTLNGIYVQRWDGATWAALGASTTSNGLAPAPDGTGNKDVRLARGAASGELLVSWLGEKSGHPEMNLSHWDGASWSALGTSLSTSGISNAGVTVARPSTMATSEGVPTVAWVQVDGTVNHLHVRRWDGSSWAPLGGANPLAITASLPAATVVAPALATDAAGRVALAWVQTDATASTEVYVAGFDAAGWHLLTDANDAAGVSRTATPSDYPLLTMSGSGRITVAWEESVASDVVEVYLRYLDWPP